MAREHLLQRQNEVSFPLPAPPPPLLAPRSLHTPPSFLSHLTRRALSLPPLLPAPPSPPPPRQNKSQSLPTACARMSWCTLSWGRLWGTRWYYHRDGGRAGQELERRREHKMNIKCLDAQHDERMRLLEGSHRPLRGGYNYSCLHTSTRARTLSVSLARALSLLHIHTHTHTTDDHLHAHTYTHTHKKKLDEGPHSSD